MVAVLPKTDVSRPMETEKIILGVDPGTMVMGYGLVAQKGKSLSIVRMGAHGITYRPKWDTAIPLTSCSRWPVTA